MLLLSVLAIGLSLCSYKKAEVSGKQQQTTLDASRTALEGTVKSLQSLTTISEQQYAREIEREGRKPKLEVSLRHELKTTSPEWRFPARGELELKIPQHSAKVFFLLKNTGNAPVLRPTYIFVADPETVKVACAAEFPQYRPSTEGNICQFNSPSNLAPTENGLPHAVGHDLQIPTELSIVGLEFMLLCENIPMQSFKTRFTLQK